MHRTPARSLNDAESHTSESPQEQQETQVPSLLNVTKTLSVRRSVGEWESGKADNSQKSGLKQATTHRSSTEPSKTPPKKVVSRSRAEEARQCHNKAKMCLSSSRNLKSDLKSDISTAVERLFQLVKEAEVELMKARGSGTREAPTPQMLVQPAPDAEAKLAQRLEENSKLLSENTAIIKELKSSLEHQKASTYAGAVTGMKKVTPKKGALHSVVVTSRDETETGEEVLEKVRKVLDAKEGWVKVERVRKAKDRKVIMGFKSIEERDKARNRIERDSAHLSVEEVKNRDPLLILRDVLRVNSDDDIMRALRSQNRGVFDDLDAGEDRVEIKYKRNTRNPLTSHLILSVSPKIWSRATQKGRLRIDLQQVRVEDQSPLVQCTRCLGYGHGRRFCKEPADLCSHCGGPHLRAECANRLAGENPDCRNCAGSKYSRTDHNAFSQDCPVRRKWDQLARSTVAYC